MNEKIKKKTLWADLYAIIPEQNYELAFTKCTNNIKYTINVEKINKLLYFIFIVRQHTDARY